MAERVRILYLTASGRYRMAKGRIDPEWPHLLQDNRGQQDHSLVRGPIFPRNEPIPFAIWEEFLASKVRNIPLDGKGSMTIVEDDNFMLLGFQPSDAGEEVATNIRLAQLQEVIQRGKDQAGANEGMLSAMAIVLMAALGFVLLVFGAMVALPRLL